MRNKEQENSACKKEEICEFFACGFVWGLRSIWRAGGSYRLYDFGGVRKERWRKCTHTGSEKGLGMCIWVVVRPFFFPFIFVLVRRGKTKKKNIM